MPDLTLEEGIKQEIIGIANEHGFENIGFDFWEEWVGRRAAQATTKDPKSIIFRYNFLKPALMLYEVHPELFRKGTKIVCLHERKHYEPTFEEFDENEVQKRAALAYGNIREFVILDNVLTFYNDRKVMFSDEGFMKDHISKNFNDFYKWLDFEEKEYALNLLTDEKFYKKKNLLSYFGLKEEKKKSLFSIFH